MKRANTSYMAFTECYLIRYIISLTTLFVLILSPMPLQASDNNVGSWLTIKKIGQDVRQPKLQYLVEVQGRWLNSDPKTEALFNLGLGYRIQPKIALWSGYRISSAGDSHDRNDEQRLWQRLVMNVVSSGNFSCSLSSQFEQRVQIEQSAVALRFRQKGKLTFPELTSSPLQPVISDELFFNLNHPQWISDRTIDQNRLFVGFNIKRHHQAIAQIGYLNQMKFRQSTIINHILSLTFLLS